MPVWHEATKQLVAEEKLVVLGLIQEQHAERARLYAQWKGFDFPILQDALTRNGQAAVPVAILIDEHGVVRNTRPRPNQIEQFVSQQFDVPSPSLDTIDKQKVMAQATAEQPVNTESVASWTNLGDAKLMWGKDSSSISAAINSYEKAIDLNPTGFLAASLDFRLGVAFRARYDSDDRRPDDFKKAVQSWTAALDANPNQYIWRRRIQQYGPRQSKPYPFYDWIEQTIADIKARGEIPVELKVPLSGSEVAKQQRQFQTEASDMKNPDPDEKLLEDGEGLINVRATAVPSSVKAGQTARVHVLFEAGLGKWNNEGQPMQVWINEPESGKLSKSAFEISNAGEANSNEPRRIEFEYQTSNDAEEPVKLSGFAVFNVCVDADGTCKFLRKNFTIVEES